MEVSRSNKLKGILLVFLKFCCMPVGVRTSCSHNWIRNGGKTVVGQELRMGCGSKSGWSPCTERHMDRLLFWYTLSKKKNPSAWNFLDRLLTVFVHSVDQKSIGLKFSKSRTGSDVRYNCRHNSSRFTVPIFAHSCRFSVLHSLQSITPRIY